MKPVELTEEQQQALTSMNQYWEEISKRDNPAPMAASEIRQLIAVFDPIKILLIVGDYAKNYSK